MKTRARSILAVLCLAASVAGCSSGPSPVEVAASLQAGLPMLERLHVNRAVLGPLASCRLLDYARGVFVVDPARYSCIHDYGVGPEATAFDAESSADADTLEKELERRGLSLRYMDATYSDTGEITYGRFTLEGIDDLYLYVPGKARQYLGDSTCGEAVTADWYREYECRDYKWPWEAVGIGPG
jgi:hypothetical protein